MQAQKASTKEKPVTWGQRQRLEFIESRLFWEGRLNRADLMTFFSISLPQASLDLASYIEIAPRNIFYDRRAKAYFATGEFAPEVTSPDSSTYLNELLAQTGASFSGWSPPVATVPHPSRRVETATLRRIIVAIRERNALRIEYQSLNRPNPTLRVVSPHAIGYDGFRWHVRAYCHERKDFRDFVFARILAVQSSETSEIDPKADLAWHSEVDIVLAPHPDLTEGQKRAIALDYGMNRGRVAFKTRPALAFYVLRHLGLEEGSGGPKTTQLIIVNRKQLEPFLKNHA